MPRDTEKWAGTTKVQSLYWLQPHVWAKTDTINQSQGVIACSFGCSLGAVAVRSCLFFSPWTGIGVWRVNWVTWGQTQISNVIESNCSFTASTEVNLKGLIGSNRVMSDQSDLGDVIVLLLIKNLHLQKSEKNWNSSRSQTSTHLTLYILSGVSKKVNKLKFRIYAQPKQWTFNRTFTKGELCKDFIML